MNKDITLVILAAGMGSRFGGLKQIEPFGPNGEFIIDYSIYDAIKAGFTKIVFLIKKENYQIFKETIGSRVEPHIKVEYCFQENDNLPLGCCVPTTRVKPLGTAHAILCCKEKINEPFMIINADDFYGRDAFIKGAKFLRNLEEQTPHLYGIITYLVKNTITKNGSVKRGICEIKNNYLTKIIESKVEKINGKTIAEPLNGTKKFEVSEDTPVSMNMLLFTPSIFDYIENNFKDFLEKNKNNLDECEYLIPEVLYKAIKENFAKVETISTASTWHGVTYKKDSAVLKDALNKLVSEKDYPNKLWEE